MGLETTFRVHCDVCDDSLDWEVDDPMYFDDEREAARKSRVCGWYVDGLRFMTRAGTYQRGRWRYPKRSCYQVPLAVHERTCPGSCSNQRCKRGHRPG